MSLPSRAVCAALAASVVMLAACSTTGFNPRSARNWRFATVEVAAQQDAQGPSNTYPARILSAETLTRQRPDEVNAYGGALDLPSRPATGYFYTDRLDDRWWLIDPDGRLFLNVGVAAVTPARAPSTASGQASSPGPEAPLTQLREQGFNSLGAGSAQTVLTDATSPLPYIAVARFAATYRQQHDEPGAGALAFVFDPRFAGFAEDYATRLAAHRDDRWLIGWYSDDTLVLNDALLDQHLALAAGEPARVEAERWLAKRQGLAQPDLSALDADDRQAWQAEVYARYAQTVASALRRQDGHHLYLGVRFNGKALSNEALFKAAGKYQDVISADYARSWAPDTELIRKWSAWSGLPVLVAGWSVSAADSGLANNQGAGWIVPTQADRGHFYQSFALALLESQVVVGWQWGAYRDAASDPAAGMAGAANTGLVDLHDTPYLPLWRAAGALNTRKYALVDWLDHLRVQRRGPYFLPPFYGPYWRDRISYDGFYYEDCYFYDCWYGRREFVPRILPPPPPVRREPRPPRTIQ